MKPHAYNGRRTGPGEAGDSRRGAEPYTEPYDHHSSAMRRMQRVLRLSRPYIPEAEQSERADQGESNDEEAQREQAEQETGEQGPTEQAQEVQTGQDGQQIGPGMQQPVEQRQAVSPEEEQVAAATAEEVQAEQPEPVSQADQAEQSETQLAAPLAMDEAREPGEAGRSRRGQGRRQGRGRRAAPGSGAGRGRAGEQPPEVTRARGGGVGRGRAAEQRSETNRARGAGRRRQRGRGRGRGQAQGQGAILELEQRLEQQPSGEPNFGPLLVQPVVNLEPQFESRFETEVRVVTPGQPQARIGEQLVREQVVQQELTDILAQQESQPELPPVPAPVPAPAETIPPQLMHLRRLPAPAVRPHIAHSQRVQALLQEQQQDLLRQQHAREALEEELAQPQAITSQQERLERVQVNLRTRELQMMGETRERQPDPEIRRVELAVHQSQVREVEVLQAQMELMQAQQRLLFETRIQEAMNESLEDLQQRQHQEEDDGRPNFLETSAEGQQQLQPQLPASNEIESIPQPLHDGMPPNMVAFPGTDFARRPISPLIIPPDIRRELMQDNPEDGDHQYDGGIALGQENINWNGNGNGNNNTNDHRNGSGNGNGYNNGNGYSNGYMNGDGNGDGYVNGNGNGDGYVNGNGNGNTNGGEEMTGIEVRFAIEQEVQQLTWAQLEEIQQDHTRREQQDSNGMDATAASRLLSHWSGRRVCPTTQFPAIPEYHPHYRSDGFYPVSRGISEALSNVLAARIEDGERIVNEEYEYFNLASGRSEELMHDGPTGDRDPLTEDNLHVGMVLVGQTTPAEYEHWKMGQDTDATWTKVELGEEVAKLRVQMERWEATVKWMWQMAEVWERDGGFEEVVEFDAGVLESMRLDGEVSDDDELAGFMDDLDVSVTTTDYDAVYC
ncbi:hypothetical protein GTR04_6926 [Trichophyton interdigitale]|nr:hypothetical protein GY631_5133 [Trichophyton interdigitale]KAG5218893.1 hypothetical protein GY632_5095 [Trichophyton interdigitale]KAG8205696.1 hypothetical protein GTR04_6926 [Trichophyton interdigitale]